MGGCVHPPGLRHCASVHGRHGPRLRPSQAPLRRAAGVHGGARLREPLDFKGLALDYFTTHMDLVARQKEAIQLKKKKKVGLANDANWTGEGFTKETDSKVSNN